ncbi:hypothetical protein CJU89_5849 [Yarrowia sp. B02]|nr:hypothetical protein CJU89_5849 [Yarrowia sp. B02]
MASTDGNDGLDNYDTKDSIRQQLGGKIRKETRARPSDAEVENLVSGLEKDHVNKILDRLTKKLSSLGTSPKDRDDLYKMIGVDPARSDDDSLAKELMQAENVVDQKLKGGRDEL